MQHQKVPPPSRLVGAPHAIQQVTPEQVPVLAKAFRAAGNKDVTSKVFPEMNHLFVHDPVGFPGNYAKLVNPRVEPEVVGAVAEWLLKRMR